MKQYFKFYIGIILFLLGTSYIMASDSNVTIKIMPLGDSITYDNRESDLSDPRPISRRTGYRSHLWYMLQDAGYAADFVGSKVAGQSVNPPFDPDNEGHPGWSSYDIAENTYSYMLQNTPDTVLLHIGTNDHQTSIAGVSEILREIDTYEQTSGHTVRVIVALIIDRKDGDRNIRIFNENLQVLITSRLLDGDNIALVDMYKGAGLNGGDYADNTHPNDRGYTKIATVWYNAILAPFNLELNMYPATIVDKFYIESVNVNATTNTVQYVAEVPSSGITF